MKIRILTFLIFVSLQALPVQANVFNKTINPVHLVGATTADELPVVRISHSQVKINKCRFRQAKCISIRNAQVEEWHRRKRNHGSGDTGDIRNQNREIQEALNYFDYPVGKVDGSLGPRSKSAIKNLENDLGFFSDGELTEEERLFLTDSYTAAKSGLNAQQQQIVEEHGQRGLLRSYLSDDVEPELTEIATIDDGENSEVESVEPSRTTSIAVSMEGYCDSIDSGDQSNLTFANLSLANGGTLGAADAEKANQTLNEQFCLARQFTMTEGQGTAVSYNSSAEQIQSICDTISNLLSDVVETVPFQSVSRTMSGTKNAISDAGGSAESMAETSLICLSYGFENDNPEITASAALMLVAAGKTPYGEIIGHQLRNGFGFTTDMVRAKDWFSMSLDAVDSGVEAAILPTQARARNAVIRKAINSGGLLAN